MSLIVAYSDRYAFDVGDHIFRMSMYGRTKQLLLEQDIVPFGVFVEPEPVGWDDLALVHDAAFLHKARTGAFRPSEIAQIQMPWSPEHVDGVRRIVGGTILAARHAVADTHTTRLELGRPSLPPLSVAVNIGGGFHHAFPDHGEGFCLFNDVAVAIRVLQRDRLIRRAAVVDVDVHQGNGTAAIFAGDESVFTFSLHQASNFPVTKVASSLDVGLADGVGDLEYLRALESALPVVFGSRPDVIFYLSGADPYRDDQLGGLDLTFEGLRGRDYVVLNAARDTCTPVVVLLAGGYAREADDTAAIHAATVAEAARLSCRPDL
jgi:acetoin utilization deacetylase AcuC-like enzyme